MPEPLDAPVDEYNEVRKTAELIDEFRRHFPLLDSLIGRFGESMPSERIPWFFAYILSAAGRPGAGACCIVLEKSRGTTAIAAILSSLMRLQQDFPSLIEQYARTEFERGQRVKVRPSEFVYEYDGVWEEYPEFFRLKVMGDGGSRSFPLVDVLRLEPTNRIRPKGTGASELGTFERSPLDHLLNLTTCGNNSLIQNTVLVQMPRTQLAGVTDALSLAPNDSTQFEPLSQFLPWGFIYCDGTLKPNDSFQVVGEPLIAVTSVPEDLALASSLADAGTKTILVDGARRLTQNLQAFDDIAERQRLVILASPNETEELELLADRGCPVWHMSANDVLVGEISGDERNRVSLVGETVRAAEVRRHSVVRAINCNDKVLEQAADSLERIAGETSKLEEAFEVEEALARLFGILFECSESCLGGGEDTASELRTAKEQIAQYARWLEPAVGEEIRDAVNALERAVSTQTGEQKADAIMSILADCDGKWAVTARSPRTAERLRDGLVALGAEVPVLPVSAINSNHEFDGIIVPAWPNDQRFTRLRNLSVSPDIRILVYPFESKWVARHQARTRARARSVTLGSETLSSILGIEPQFLAPSSGIGNDIRDVPEKEVSLDLPVFKLEERVSRRQVMYPSPASDGEDSREAQLVQFLGGCYALLTEWAELPLLNNLIDNSHDKSVKLTRESVSRLSTGDFVLFRASGDKEFMRLIAEESLGVQEYQRIRNIAERWKAPLHRLGHSPTAIQRRLAQNGLDRTRPTIAGWLGNPDRIGPANHDDIQTIAMVAGDAELLAITEEVGEAITRIRSTHSAAGMHLTRLILSQLRGRLNEMGDQPTLLDLDYGQAWVVQVESVETKQREYATSLVNRLLWVADIAF